MKALTKFMNAFDFVFNDTVMTVGEFLACMYTLAGSLYFALTGVAEILPRIGWFAIFGFMLITGLKATEDLLYVGFDEEDEEETEEDEDDA
jgi:hypothetical protein